MCPAKMFSNSKMHTKSFAIKTNMEADKQMNYDPVTANKQYRRTRSRRRRASWTVMCNAALVLRGRR